MWDDNKFRMKPLKPRPPTPGHGRSNFEQMENRRDPSQ
ncbi:hypothetical protein DSBG_3851 [Desulfosporosinus sp. BG]|nr:hypothetical protein DSBG_3851 [Desulfosporosinus sp. BG]